MKFSFASTALCLMSLMPSIHSQQDDGFCQDRNGNIKGPSGLQLIADDEERIRLDRRGGELCGCSYVSQSCDLTVRHGSFYSRCILNSSNIPKQAQTKCEIDGEPCSSLVVNGTEATKDGVANYPSVNISYTIKICNFNDADMNFAPTRTNSNTGEEEIRSYLQFWYTAPTVTENEPAPARQDIVDEAFTNTADVLQEGLCKKVKGTLEVSTTISKFFMQANVQGPLSIADTNATLDDKFCYAYSFNPIELQYDYGDPTCEMSVSILAMAIVMFSISLSLPLTIYLTILSQTEAYCLVASGEDGAGTPCEDYIDNMTADNVRVFTGTYYWKVRKHEH